MDDLLTTSEVEDLLKIDRTTVYRMLKDGRLRGVKVGQQWRFGRRSVEAILSAAPAPAPATATPAQLPLHCVQTIQDLFADVAQVGVLVADLDGAALTRPSGDARSVAALRAGAAAAARGAAGPIACGDGAVCAVARIMLDGRPIGVAVAGPVGRQAHAALAGRMGSLVRAIESLGHERAAMLARLGRIAALSTFSDDLPARQH